MRRTTTSVDVVDERAQVRDAVVAHRPPRIGGLWDRRAELEQLEVQVAAAQHRGARARIA
jgi:hypothetical protein